MTAGRQYLAFAALLALTGCGSGRDSVYIATRNGLSVTVFNRDGGEYVRLESTLDDDRTIAFPTRGSIYVLRDGKKWQLDGSSINAPPHGVGFKPSLWGFEDLVFLHDGIGVDFRIVNWSQKATVVVEVEDVYSAEVAHFAARKGITCWTGKVDLAIN